MQAIFGDKYRVEDESALVAIQGNENADYWRMSLRASKELPDGRTVVVVNGAPSDEEGSDNAGHGSSGMLNVYTLRHAQGAWQVLERHENAGMLGSNGQIGSVKWIDLGSGKPGIVMSSGGTWQGYTVSEAEIFDLDRRMRSLGSFSEYSDSNGACIPDLKDCWQVEGTISTVPAARPDDYRDIVVEFKGRHYRVIEEANGNYVERSTRSINQTARYRFNGKEYILVAGENPVPNP